MQHDRSLIWPANLGCYASRCRLAWRPACPRHARPAWTGPVLGPSAWLEDSSRARARDRHRAHENAPAGRSFLPVTDRNMVKHRVQPGLTRATRCRWPQCPRTSVPGVRSARDRV